MLVSLCAENINLTAAEGNSSVYQVNPVSRRTGEEGAGKERGICYKKGIYLAVKLNVVTPCTYFILLETKRSDAYYTYMKASMLTQLQAGTAAYVNAMQYVLQNLTKASIIATAHFNLSLFNYT